MAAPQNFVNVSRRPPDVEDYIDILRRYRSWVIGPTFAGLVISVVVACYLPNVYVCRASMRIKPSILPDDLVAAQSTGRMAQRFQELRQEILGRDNLINMIMNPKLDLYKNERAHYPVEDVAELYFAKKLHISEIDRSSDASNRGAQAFAISFEYPDRVKSQKVVAQLMTDITNKQQTLQSSQTQSTTLVVEDLLKVAQDKLDEANKAVADFGAQNQGRLPENFQTNMMDVDTKNAQLITLNDQIAQEKQHQALLESQMSNNRNTQAQIQANLNVPVTVTNSAVKNQTLINLEQAIANKDGECIVLEKRYQLNFPAVQACLDQKKSLEEKDSIEKAEGSSSGGGQHMTMVVSQQAQSQLDQLKADYKTLEAQYNGSILSSQNKERQVVEVAQQLKVAQDKVAASPAIIQKYQTLQQSLKLAQEDYERKSKSNESSRTQQTVEGHMAGETLDILENAITPDTPYSPNRGAIIGIGTVIGLVLGFALAGAKEIKNTSLKNLKDVRAYTNLPVLSSIPLLENALLVRRKRRLAWLAWSSAVIVGGVAMCIAVYYQVVIASQVG